MARTYRRDKNGKFSGGGGSSGGGGGGASAGGGGKKGPKTAAGRASANLKAGEKGRQANPMDKKAANKATTAAAAKDYYKATGTGRKGAAKPGKKAAPAKAAPAKAAPKAEAKTAAPKSKSAATKAANQANTDRLTAKGQTAIGGRLKKSTAKSYSGTKATKDKMAQSWANAGDNKRNAVRGESVGANFSKAKVKGTMGKRKK
tara:strand:+ start:367 stop:975 length:609 start_codon:yes stop_codon:yes gene_type:complete